MLGGRTAVRPSWPPAPGHAPIELPPPPPAHQATDGFNRYGLYSLFPGDVYATPRYAHSQPAPGHAPGHAQYHAPLLPPTTKECVFAPVVERGASASQLQELMSKKCRPAPRLRREEPCACRDKTSTAPVSPGCSRTTPVTLKREPGSGTPCQVAEVTTSAVKIKQEPPDPVPAPSTGSGGSIPVGIAVARQRSVQETRVKEDPTPSLASQLHPQPPLPPLVAAAALECKRPTNEPVAWAPPTAPGHAHALALAPPLPLPPPLTFWPGCGAAVEQALPVGYQLARDPVSGQLLLISTPTPTAAPAPAPAPNIGNNISHLSGVMWPPPPLVLPPAQPALLLDRLVTLAAPTPPPPPPHRRPHLEPAITGVLPCGKSSVVIAQQVSSAAAAAQVSQQAPVSQYCTGSVLIQHISGATQPAVIPHHPAVSGSVLISTQQLSAEAQSLLTGHAAGGLVLSQDSTTASSHPHSVLHTPLAFLQSQPPLAPPPHQPTIHLQIKESHKQQEVEEQQLDEKTQIMSETGCRSQVSGVRQHFKQSLGGPGCRSQISGLKPHTKPSMSGPGFRSQATSPVPCLSPAECQSQDEVELDVEVEAEAVQQADASNQTSLPGSSDEEPDEQTHPHPPTRPLTQPKSQVDLSGLELLSAASIEQIERSHSAPLAEPAKIKTEVEEEVMESQQAQVIVLTEVVVKEEVSEDVVSADEMAVAGAVAGGLGLLCDVAHRFIEQEASVDDVRQDNGHQDIDHQDDNHQDDDHQDDDDQDDDHHDDDHQDDAHQDDDDQDDDHLEDDHQDDDHQEEDKCIVWVEEEAEVEEVHDPAERDMRERLAELRRLYREKQRELSRLKPRCNTNQSDSVSGAKRGPGRPRKGSTGLKRPRSASPPPPVLQPWSPPPPTLTPNKQPTQRSLPTSASVDTQVEWELVSPPSLSPAQSPSSASQKRKVGRPRKRDDHSRGSLTIVAKKSALVGLLLAKKQQQDTDQPHKIRPKLKAEVKMKSSSCEEEEMEWTSEAMPARPVKSKSLPTPTPTTTPHRKPVMVLAKRKRAVSAEQPSVTATLPQPLNMPGVGSCQLTTAHLMHLPCRVLVGRAGLFYAGQLSGVRPPDLYGITLDGERSHRPHIHSREEILNDTILEVRSSVLPRPGTRVCAYWSQQYRCLYPGTTVADDDPCFVSVEFDDGDSGRISLEDIRLLPQDYPVVVYDPNPLQTLGKRRRRHSDHSSQPGPAHTPVQTIEAVAELEAKIEPTQESVPEVEPQQTEADLPSATPSQDPDIEAAEKERRRQKKKRKEKQRRLEGEKKHKHGHKHRDCLKPHRHKHKHHRHRHRHRHSKTTATANTGQGAEDLSAGALIVHTIPPPLPTIKLKKDKKQREREVESRSKMAAFLPARQLWRWAGRGYKRPGARGRARKAFYKSIQRGNETISVGDCAVFLSTGRPDRPYIGRIESMWESWAGSMVVRVKWFYHPEETVGCPEKLPFPGALFESPHNDENDVQTISHKCEVLPLETYKYRLSLEPHRLATIYDYNDTYYLAGHYDPTSITLRLEPGVDTNTN